MTLVAGSARVDVTPDGPVPMSGYGNRDGPSTGVHDPLEAAALVLSDGATTAAVVSIDLLNVSRELCAGIERRVREAGVAIDDLIVLASHTHGGPYVPTPAIDVHPTLRVEEDVSGVVADLERGSSDAVIQAAEGREPATLRVGRTRDDETVVNRRESNGARIPENDVDDAVVGILIEGESGAETVLYNRSCHPVSIRGSDRDLTADWPGMVRRRIAAERDTDPTVLFANGAAGDLSTRPQSPDSMRGDDPYAYMERMGEEHADTVLEALSAAESSAGHDAGPVLTASETLRLPVKSTPPVEALDRRERELVAERDALGESAPAAAIGRCQRDLNYVRELRAIADWSVRSLPARLPYLEIGPLGLVGLPFEPFSRHGIDLRAAASVEHLVVAGYAGDYLGYLPTLRALENWGYEIRTTKLAARAIPTVRRTAIDLVSGD